MSSTNMPDAGADADADGSAALPESNGATEASSQNQKPASRVPPATMEERRDGDDEEGEEAAVADQDRGVIVPASEITEEMLHKKKKKKKSRKPASKRGLDKPTGFEEFHADAPLTPEQYLELKAAFDPAIPFVDRILRAIQRFERTRKLSPERRNIFYKYLAYGGVDVGPNMFVGAQDTEDMDKDEVTTAMARADISEETKQTILNPKQDQPDDDDATAEGSKLHSSQHLAKYVVDFEGTMKSFLSRRAAVLFVFETSESVNLITTTLERFMDYLLQHNVCPEYQVEVLSTRNLCRTAGTELWTCTRIQHALPGSFNTACSTLFGAAHLRRQEALAPDADFPPSWGPEVTTKPVTLEGATQIMGFAVAGAATESVYEKYLELINAASAAAGTTARNGTRPSHHHDHFRLETLIDSHAFEVTHTVPPSPECLALYRDHNTPFPPVGALHAKFFANPDAPPEDSSPPSSPSLKNPMSEQHFTFFVEHDILELFRPGMRIEATIYRLNCGVWFFDEVRVVRPSFDQWCANEMMLGWRDGKWIPGAGALDHESVDVNRGEEEGEREGERERDEEEVLNHGHEEGDERGETGGRADDDPY